MRQDAASGLARFRNGNSFILEDARLQRITTYNLPRKDKRLACMTEAMAASAEVGKMLVQRRPFLSRLSEASQLADLDRHIETNRGDQDLLAAICDRMKVAIKLTE